MKTNELSTCFCTSSLDECRNFYCLHFYAKLTFDCGWYLNLKLGEKGPSIQFMQPRGDMKECSGEGVTLNFQVDDVDREFTRLTAAGVELIMPLEDHPWGDRGFSIVDPIGNSIYIYSNREPTQEFKQYYVS